MKLAAIFFLFALALFSGCWAWGLYPLLFSSSQVRMLLLDLETCIGVNCTVGAFMGDASLDYVGEDFVQGL